MKHRYMVAVAAALVLVACGDETCSDESLDVLPSTAGTCSSLAPGSVTVSLQVCATCNQTTTNCVVDRQPRGSGTTETVVQLDPLAEACESGSSCPLPSCGLNEADRKTVSCTFVAQPTDTQILVFDGGSGTLITKEIDVTSGGPTSCEI